MPDFDKIVKVKMIPDLIRDKRGNVYNSDKVKEGAMEAAAEWAITDIYDINILNLDITIEDDWTGVAKIDLSNNQNVEMRCDANNLMTFSVNGLIIDQTDNDGMWYVCTLAFDALQMYNRHFKKIQKLLKDNPIYNSSKLKGPRDMGTFEHLMTFETYFTPSMIRIFQGFEGENAQYFDEAIELGVECVADHFAHMPGARQAIKYDTMDRTSKQLSLFALDPDNNVVGVVFITQSSIFNEIERHKRFGFDVTIEKDLTQYRSKRGLHGFLFGVKKTDRKSYIAWMLMQDVLKRFANEYDYFYGIQAEMFKSNINYDKRAELVALIHPMGEYKMGYIYLKDL